MTIRGGGRPREASQAHPLEPGTYDAAPWPELEQRRQTRSAALNGRRNGYGHNGHRGGLAGLIRFLVFALVLAAIVLTATLTVLRPVVSGAVAGWAYDNPGALRIPFVADIVRENLGGALTDPASTDSTEVPFGVVAGDTPASIAPRLVAQGLLKDERAFIFEATLQNLTPQLKEGDFRLAASMTPAQLVSGLVNNQIVNGAIPVTFREGLRLEQITAKLETLAPPVTIDPKQFYDLATKPPAALLADYPWLKKAGLPKGASLEGFLYPATYKVTAETSAEGLLRQMLDAFAQNVGVERMTVPKARGMTFYKVLTLASLVEREARLDTERPLIAGVFQNRLDPKKFPLGKFQSDATIFYVNDSLKLSALPFEQWQQYTFWNGLGGEQLPQDLPAALAGYNTYTSKGLMPGPICSPAVASIDAALKPDTKDGYLYFLAKNDGSNASAFAKTAAEHQHNKEQYGG